MKVFLINKDLGNKSHVTIKAFANQEDVYQVWGEKVKEFKDIFPEADYQPYWIQEVFFQK